jgi:hypothetical protein
MIRLSVSDLESYRYWKDNEDSNLDDLIAKLTSTFEPTPQMMAGRALAKLFEHARGRTLLTEESEGWEFHFEIDGELVMPNVTELKAEEVFETPRGPVMLVGKVDGLDGIAVHDQKLSEKVDAERYLDSLQWRSYLVMFGAKKFVYDVFLGRYATGGEQRVTITDYLQLPFYAYPNMRADVEKAVCELAEVVARYVKPGTWPAWKQVA